MRALGFRLYLVLVVSWFLHIPTRIRPLGIIRFDLLMILAVAATIFMVPPEKKFTDVSDTNKWLKTILIYAIATIPLIEWPGTVVKQGIPSLIKVVIYYFYTVELVTTRERLKSFVLTFLFCQAFRVLEPVALHLTTGYWGDAAHMSNWEFMNRLSGAPSDVINPNGLAFIILTALPFFHYLTDVGFRYKVVYAFLAPIFMYALVLTGSRTGIVCLLVVGIGFWMKSRHKVLLTAIFIAAVAGSIPFLSANMKDRYLSLVDKNTNNAQTVNGRIAAVEENFEIVMRRPIFGFGLGTSVEANAHYGSYGKIAHNLYAEIAQELGFVGLFIFIMFIRSIVRNFAHSLKELRAYAQHAKFMTALTDGMQVWIFMNIIFSFASFGLHSYEWYLFGGLSTVLKRLAAEQAEAGKAAVGQAEAPVKADTGYLPWVVQP